MEADQQQSSMREEATNQPKKKRRGKTGRSTKEANADVSANAQIYQLCMDIFKYLQKEDKKVDSIFAEPVDEEADTTMNYYDVIKEPMDLKTIHKKLRVWGQDKEANDVSDEFAACVRLMFQNAMAYNDSPTHPVHIAAKILLEKFENKFLEVKQLQEGAQRKEKQKGQRAQNKSEQQEHLPLVVDMIDVMSSLQEQMIQISQHMIKMEQQMNSLSSVIANLSFVGEGGEEKKDESIKGRNQSRGPRRGRSKGQATSKVNNTSTKEPAENNEDEVAAAKEDA
uniref:Bromo domain-containing protein n=1 Tax=Ditylum brightwellii TaxID=49249 RepID=A0A7S1Z7K1_9STRA|mmetsp:Transcript_26257/g.39039  ORF Transcript_26257/g.39039 Transcript_26257/m.39039 type:complete len:282 (+) Transcript_26257:238-1083(+)